VYSIKDDLVQSNCTQKIALAGVLIKALQDEEGGFHQRFRICLSHYNSLSLLTLFALLLVPGNCIETVRKMWLPIVVRALTSESR